MSTSDIDRKVIGFYCGLDVINLVDQAERSSQYILSVVDAVLKGIEWSGYKVVRDV